MSEPIYEDLTNYYEQGRRFMEDHIAKLKQEAGRAEHAVTSHLPHHGYHDPQQQEQPREDPMTLASIEADIRNSVENADAWLKRVAETHLPALQAAAAEVASDPLAQAIESVFLPDDVKTMLAELVTKLGTAKAAAPSEPESDAAAPAQPDVPAAVPQPASGQPVAAGAAT